MTSSGIEVGVLALQGAFQEHIDMLNNLQLSTPVHAFAVRRPEELAKADALVLPGGESTTIGKVAVASGLLEPLKEWVSSQRPMWGTCAGMIMLSSSAKHEEEGGQNLLGGMDVSVSRNFFGRQVRSFESKISGPPGDDGPYNAIFIRAPAIISTGDDVQVLSKLHCAQPADGSDPQDVIVAARQGSLLATAFHPELTSDDRWHRYFIRSIVSSTVKTQ